MRRTLTLIATSTLLTFVACGGAETSDSRPVESGSSTVASAGGAPRVEAVHQKAINDAWQKASGGEVPTNDCARIKGLIVGSKKVAESPQALQACNVDIPAQYFLARLDRVERGEETCQAFMMGVITQLPAMTMATAGLEGLVAQGGVGDQAAPDAAGGLIATAVREGTSDLGADDPKRLIKDRIADRTRQLCPDMAGPLGL